MRTAPPTLATGAMYGIADIVIALDEDEAIRLATALRRCVALLRPGLPGIGGLIPLVVLSEDITAALTRRQAARTQHHAARRRAA